jgi:hypothetical protein
MGFGIHRHDGEATRFSFPGQKLLCRGGTHSIFGPQKHHGTDGFLGSEKCCVRKGSIEAHRSLMAEAGSPACQSEKYGAKGFGRSALQHAQSIVGPRAKSVARIRMAAYAGGFWPSLSCWPKNFPSTMSLGSSFRAV